MSLTISSVKTAILCRPRLSYNKKGFYMVRIYGLMMLELVTEQESHLNNKRDRLTYRALSLKMGQPKMVLDWLDPRFLNVGSIKPSVKMGYYLLRRIRNAGIAR